MERPPLFEASEDVNAVAMAEPTIVGSAEDLDSFEVGQEMMVWSSKRLKSMQSAGLWHLVYLGRLRWCTLREKGVAAAQSFARDRVADS